MACATRANLFGDRGPDGSFAFNHLVANTYRVAVDILSLPPNIRPTFDLDGTNTPNVATITLGAGQNVMNANFGYQGGEPERRDDGRVDRVAGRGGDGGRRGQPGNHPDLDHRSKRKLQCGELVDGSSDANRQQDRLCDGCCQPGHRGRS